MKSQAFGFVIASVMVSACVPMGGMPWRSGAGGAGGAPASAQSGGTATGTAGDGAPGDTAPPPPEVLSGTGAAKQLQRITKDSTHESRPRLSNDGARLMAHTWSPEVVDGVETGGYAEQALVTMKPDGRGRSLLTKRGVAALEGAWLPKTILYVANVMGGWQLVRAAKPTSGSAYSVVVRADDITGGIGQISTSKDGQLIAFSAVQGEHSSIGTVRPDGTDLMMLGDGWNPRLSPDGTRIVFERNVDGRWQLFTMDQEGGDVTTVTDLPGSSGAPNWSPDGSRIVFTSSVGSERFADPSTARNLYTIRPDGSDLVQLTDGPRTSTEPCWGTDGWVYFASNESGTWDIWRIKPALD